MALAADCWHSPVWGRLTRAVIAAVFLVLTTTAHTQAQIWTSAGQTPAPAGVVDVASCESFLVSVGSDSGNAQVGCQAIGTLSQTVNQSYSAVFRCGWAQATAMHSGAQMDAPAMLACLGLGG
jgi:hypothetical protein